MTSNAPVSIITQATDTLARTDAATLLNRAGLAWDVEKRPVFLADGSAIETHRAIVRRDTNTALGIVGAGWEPVQNADSLGVLDVLAKSNEAAYLSAGSDDGGRSVWVRAKVARKRAEVVRGDLVSLELLVRNSHVAQGAYSAKLIARRLVCTNGLVRSERDSVFALRHTRLVRDRFAEAQRMVEAASDRFDALIAHFRTLASARLDGVRLNDYVQAVFPDPEDATSTRAIGNAQRIRAEIHARTVNGFGVELPGVRGTAWGAYNAVTEYVDHSRHAEWAESRRFADTTTGRGADIKARALATALEFAKSV